MPPLSATYIRLGAVSASDSLSTFSADLPTLSSTPSTQGRVAHLAQLQTSLKKLQSDINAFLTHKMDQDKTAGVAKADEAKDEETYGEEVVDED